MSRLKTRNRRRLRQLRKEAATIVALRQQTAQLRTDLQMARQQTARLQSDLSAARRYVEFRAQEMAERFLNSASVTRELLKQAAYAVAAADAAAVQEWMNKNVELCQRKGLYTVADTMKFLEAHSRYDGPPRVPRVLMHTDQEMMVHTVCVTLPEQHCRFYVEAS